MTTDSQTEAEAKASMDAMYRWTRHVYDLSRKYYLLGRDKLIQNMKVKTGEIICEIGCGTARNLIKMAELHPRGEYYGIDASEEMLKTANKSLIKHGLEWKIKLAHGFSQSFDPVAIFSLDRPVEKFVFSYALSIIPPWRDSIDHALTILPSGGEMHIVDFGGQEDLPSWFRQFLFWWLEKFHVYHKPEILDHLRQLQSNGRGALEIRSLYKGYSYLAVFKKA